MLFEKRQPILFRHCDPAGMVFYPRYFEMMNDLIETFFATIPGYGFHELHPRFGLPTVEISSTFMAPSRQGDVVRLTLEFTKIGRSSVHTAMVCTCAQEVRFTARSVLVFTDANGWATPWPAEVRHILEIHQTGKTP